MRGDGSAVHLDEALHQREPDAEPARGAATRPVGLHEHVEDARQHLGRDADAGIAHRDDHVVVLADYVQPAYRFVESGHILLELNEQSDLQSGRVQALPDAVDSTIRRAMAQNIGVSILEKHDALARHGKIGALTRY